MKKAKRFLTGLLSAVLALSLCAMPAMAEGTGETTPTTPLASAIDKDAKGTITIHKYEYNGNEDKAGTGVAGDENNVPTDAKDLEGATFTYYQVMTADELVEYYNGKSTEKVGINTYVDKNGQILSAYANKPNGSGKTGKNGIVKFGDGETGLPVGLYVIIETETPAKVTTPVEPFLVSLPMANPTNKAEWMYDVYVFPKNATTYGKVTLEKKGRVGGGTPENLNGVTYKLEKKVKDDPETWEEVTKNEQTDEDLGTLKTTDGKITVSGLSQGTYRFIEQSYDPDTGYILDQTPIVFVVDSEGKITYGSKTESNVTIEVINEKPDLEKKVIDKDNTETEDTDYSVGDHVPYTITVSVPNNITKLSTFEVTDTPNNLKYDGNATLTCEGIAVDEAVYRITTKGEDVPANGFKITFTPAAMENYAGKNIVISYTAEMTAAASTPKDGNHNTAKLKYTNKINVDGQPDDGSNSEIHDDTVVYSYTINVHKDGDDKKNLVGVKFDLYKQVPEQEAGDKALTADEVKAYGLPTAEAGKVWVKVNTDTLVTDSEGNIHQDGLANGDYYLVEKETLDSYNLLNGPVKVTLNISEETSWNENFEYKDGVLTKHDWDQKTTKFTDDKGKDVTDTATITVTVINRKGFDLPTTGGFGTLLFSGIGALLVVGGVGVLPIDKDGNVILVRQFRYAFDTELLEMPAGKMDHGPEDAEECGLRELKEETGCTAGRIVPLGAIYPSPGFLTEVTYLFAALDLTEGEMQPDEDEFVEVVRLPIAEVEKMIERDEIRDAKTVAAMYRAKLKNLY